MTLREFISFLDGHKLIDASKIKEDDDAGTDNRLKLQKYSYFAKFFGLDLGYIYSVHLCGPYSRKLTSECYDLDIPDADNSPTLPSLDHGEFLTVLGEKSSDWLEIATTIIHETKMEGNIPSEHMYMMKPDHDHAFIDSVYRDLETLHLC